MANFSMNITDPLKLASGFCIPEIIPGIGRYGKNIKWILLYY